MRSVPLCSKDSAAGQIVTWVSLLWRTLLMLLDRAHQDFTSQLQVLLQYLSAKTGGYDSGKDRTPGLVSTQSAVCGRCSWPTGALCRNCGRDARSVPHGIDEFTCVRWLFCRKSVASPTRGLPAHELLARVPLRNAPISGVWAALALLQ